MRLFRKVIRITALDSPNVRLALAQQAAGIPITNEILVPGVLTWQEYQKRRATWDKVRQCVGLDGWFYEGAQLLLFPPEWLNRAHQIAEGLRGKNRKAKAGGCDPGEGGANTAMTAIDEHGLIECVSKKTPDTYVIVEELKAFLQRHQIPFESFCIDRGGGGKQIADILRRDGYPIRSVAFGEAISLPISYGKHTVNKRKQLAEDKYTYLNRRIQMYGDMREMLDPSLTPQGFGIPLEYYLLRSQMAPIPLQYDPNGRMILPPKHRRPGQKENSIKTLVEIVGSSLDELDSFVLALHGFLHPESRAKVGAAWK